MRELSLNIMDVAQNCISAGASLIRIEIRECTGRHLMQIDIIDDGHGMSGEQIQQVADPFYTTRTTRRVGLGVPLFKMACEMTGGSLDIVSSTGERQHGTSVKAVFHTDHIDMVPLGGINETVLLLITANPHLDFVFERTFDGARMALDTRELRDVLGGDVPLSNPDVTAWIRDYLTEQTQALMAQGISGNG